MCIGGNTASNYTGINKVLDWNDRCEYSSVPLVLVLISFKSTIKAPRESYVVKSKIIYIYSTLQMQSSLNVNARHILLNFHKSTNTYVQTCKV